MTTSHLRDVRNMDEFYQRFLPKTWKRIQRKRRIREVGLGRAMAEEALEKAFGKGRRP